MKYLVLVVSVGFPLAPALMLAVVLQKVLTGQGVSLPAWLATVLAVFVALMFEGTGAIMGKAYQERIKSEGWFNQGLFFVALYVVAAIAVMMFAHDEITSDLLLAMLIAFPFLSIATYVNMSYMEDKTEKRKRFEDAQKTERTERAAVLKLEREQRAAEHKAKLERRAETHRAKLSGGTTTTVKAKPVSEKMSAAERRDAIVGLIGNGVSQPPALAKAVNVTTRTVYRDVSALAKAGRITENGQGYSVTR